MTNDDTIEPLVIRSEADAWAALEAAMSGDTSFDDTNVRFEGWPAFSMDAKGRDWTVRCRRASCRHCWKCSETSIVRSRRHSTASSICGACGKRTADGLEVVVRVKEGSSLFSADLSSQLNKIAGAVFGRMNGTQATISVLGIALAISAPVMYKSWLQERQAEKQMTAQVELSKQETERMRVFAAAVKQQPEIAVVKDDVIETANKMLKATRPGDTLSMKGVPVTAEEARELVQPEHERAKDVELNGSFRIIGNRTDKGSGFRITVRRESDGMQFSADVPQELDWDGKQAIQHAEWTKSLVVLAVDAEMLHDKIARAVVISAKSAEG
ncbi:hypothetical protein [Rhodanobacter lindaniclasticus]